MCRDGGRRAARREFVRPDSLQKSPRRDGYELKLLVQKRHTAQEWGAGLRQGGVHGDGSALARGGHAVDFNVFALRRSDGFDDGDSRGAGLDARGTESGT